MTAHVLNIIGASLKNLFAKKIFAVFFTPRMHWIDQYKFLM